MKEEILKLRDLGCSYNEIKKQLGCSKSVISYHCKNNGLDKPNNHPNKTNDELINKIINGCKVKTRKEVAIELNVSVYLVNKYARDNKIKNISYKKKDLKYSICTVCGKKTKHRYNKLFCSSKCSAKNQHREAYANFLANNDKYCIGNYTPKSFKDYFLEEQNNKCDICGISPIWENKSLVFVLDHIDGNASNNKRNNLRLICPNCDSQTDTFKSKTKNSKRRNYWKEKIIKEHGG